MHHYSFPSVLGTTCCQVKNRIFAKVDVHYLHNTVVFVWALRLWFA